MSGLRVLLVDDEGELVYTMAERLSLRGYNVDAVTDGAEALEHVASNTYDVAVVDVKMPGISGLVVLKVIKRDCPQTPVILLTGHGSIEEGEEGMKQGAYAYLFKPVDIEDLIRTMVEAAGEHRR
jgi:DNA-binding NtrC family response regulator